MLVDMLATMLSTPRLVKEVGEDGQNLLTNAEECVKVEVRALVTQPSRREQLELVMFTADSLKTDPLAGLTPMVMCIRLEKLADIIILHVTNEFDGTRVSPPLVVLT